MYETCASDLPLRTSGINLQGDAWQWCEEGGSIYSSLPADKEFQKPVMPNLTWPSALNDISVTKKLQPRSPFIDFLCFFLDTNLPHFGFSVRCFKSTAHLVCLCKWHVLICLIRPSKSCVGPNQVITVWVFWGVNSWVESSAGIFTLGYIRGNGEFPEIFFL